MSDLRSPILLLGVGYLLGQRDRDRPVDGISPHTILSLRFKGNKLAPGVGNQVRRKLTDFNAKILAPTGVPTGYKVILNDIHIHTSLGMGIQDLPYARRTQDLPDRRQLELVQLEDAIEMGVFWQAVKNGKPLEPYIDMMPTSSLGFAATSPKVRVGLNVAQTVAEEFAGAALGFGRNLGYRLPLPINLKHDDKFEIQLRLTKMPKAVEYSAWVGGWMQTR